LRSGVIGEKLRYKGRPKRNNNNKEKLGKQIMKKRKSFRGNFLKTDQATDPLEDSFIPSMKSQNRTFWMVHWWVLGHSSHVSAQLSPEVVVYSYR
jgi:hypothetical protein